MMMRIIFGQVHGCVAGFNKVEARTYLSGFIEGAGGKIKAIYIVIIVFAPSS